MAQAGQRRVALQPTSGPPSIQWENLGEASEESDTSLNIPNNSLRRTLKVAKKYEALYGRKKKKKKPKKKPKKKKPKKKKKKKPKKKPRKTTGTSKKRRQHRAKYLIAKREVIDKKMTLRSLMLKYPHLPTKIPLYRLLNKKDLRNMKKGKLM